MKRLLCSIAFGLAAANPSLACTVPKPFKLSILRSAEVVIRAKVVGYTPATFGRSVLELDTIESLTGTFKHVKHWTATWVHATGRDEWARSAQVIVGLRAVIDRDGVPVIEIVDDVCRGPSILDDTPENLNSVMDLLREPPAKQLR
ncbi:hypothetical protein J2Y48_003692 [Mycoplana sp. BE70]|uniref:hypothetical protein n=1 Tax=Mycoplana sp. BE70 TaxID=2817775 RepID=UPI00285946CD|nr:hypothetical protein [Mycoplana sp. BE70]MDR6758393.1 hypothetical protein [Mycoplana sp. BE70]